MKFKPGTTVTVLDSLGAFSYLATFVDYRKLNKYCDVKDCEGKVRTVPVSWIRKTKYHKCDQSYTQPSSISDGCNKTYLQGIG